MVFSDFEILLENIKIYQLRFSVCLRLNEKLNCRCAVPYIDANENKCNLTDTDIKELAIPFKSEVITHKINLNQTFHFTRRITSKHVTSLLPISAS